jgi:carbamoyl-phosphate synthase large subunit
MIGIVLSLNSEKPAIQDVFREGRPNILDLILNKQVSLIINTPWAKRDAIADESAIRKAAIKYKVPYITTLAGANMTVKGIAAAKKGHGEVKSLQEYHASIEEI